MGQARSVAASATPSTAPPPPTAESAETPSTPTTVPSSDKAAASDAPLVDTAEHTPGLPAASLPPPPLPGLRCGGFFFAFDPNIGLWNDKVNPNWRFTFTDPHGKQGDLKQRVPYAFTIQHRGPHAELALRFQFGFVQSDAVFATVPESFAVESGWEATLPMPLSGIRLGHTVVRAEAQTATVYRIDFSLGLCVGAQKAVSGLGTRGSSELSWRGEVAMASFVVAALLGVYGVVTLPRTWMDFVEDLLNEEDFSNALAFDAMDIDGDGFISREDLRTFVKQGGLNQSGVSGLGAAEADALFDLLDARGAGRVTFEEFQDFLDKVKAGGLEEGMAGGGFGERQAGLPYNPVELKPFGGAFSGYGAPFPGAAQPGSGFASPFGTPSRPLGPGPNSPFG